MFSKIKNEYFIFLVGFLIYFPIILWGGYFLDDNYRSIYAYYGWTGDYRPIGDWVYNILGLSSSFVDTFPLNYIIQFFIITYFIIFFTDKIKKDFSLKSESKNYISMSISFLFISPFFMQNLYFRYDSLIMVVSVVSACFPYFFNNRKIDFICCLIVLFTYQSSIVGYMCIVVLRILILSLNNENKVKIYEEIWKSVLIFVFAFLIFFLSASFLIIPNSYAENHKLLINSYDMFIENIIFSLKNLKFSNSLFEYAVVVFSLIVFISFVFKVVFNNSSILLLDKIKIFSLIVIVLFICFFNANIILLKPRLYLRTYIGIGFLFFLVGLCFTVLMGGEDNRLKNYIYFFKFLLIVNFVMCINIFYAGYNYIRETERYSENIIRNISYDILGIGQCSYDSIMVYGEINYPLRAQVLEQRYPILKQSLPNKFDFKKHRIFYDLLVNSGCSFNKNGYQVMSVKHSYNSHITDKPNIERADYNIVITDNNELFIYFKNHGRIIKSPIFSNRLN
ncbi:glucosyltransferase domain-containing protein [Acinetobacter baumannii]|uniref:glucosyltransferase domain-containing protein n=2 Tax=Acinetobacter baumannii TaxID=470 RepID=UPI003AF781A3